jgi:hypothetical protein
MLSVIIQSVIVPFFALHRCIYDDRSLRKLGAVTFRITTLSIMTLMMKGLCVMFCINDTQHSNALNYAEFNYAQCHFAEHCGNFFDLH